MNTFTAWLTLFRLPFHSVGILPYLLGVVLAWRWMGVFRWDVFAWGTAGVVLIMLSTYTAGEYWDIVEDRLSSHHGGRRPSRFAGGSRVVVHGRLPRRAALWASLISLVLAAGVGFLLQFRCRTGPWTIPLGAAGMIGGFFYSTRPIRWVSRGWGELWIAFCYGWLPIAVGVYLQTATIPPLVHWLAAPIGLSIFNVILINEFPDYPADLASGKRNMAVRLGLERAALLYGVVAVASWTMIVLSLRRDVPLLGLWLILPFLGLSVTLALFVLRGRWQTPRILEQLCAGTLIVNLGITMTFVIAFLGVNP